MNKDRIILHITPQTNVRATQGAKKLFYTPEECPVSCGLPRKSQRQPKVIVSTMKEEFPDLWEVLGGDEWQNRRKKKEMRYGCPHSLAYEQLMFKRRLVRYNEYKKAVKELADAVGFEIPVAGWSLYFYFPVATSWSNKKKIRMHGQHHLNTPDVDNCEKAFYDSMQKQDKQNAQLSGKGKFWVNQERGYIEILLNQPVYNPFNVKFIQS